MQFTDADKRPLNRLARIYLRGLAFANRAVGEAVDPTLRRRLVQQHQFLALWSGSHVQAIFTLIRPPGRARVGRGAAVMERGQPPPGPATTHPHTHIDIPRHPNPIPTALPTTIPVATCHHLSHHFAAAGGGDNRRAGRPTSHSASSEHRVNSPDRNTDGLPAESARRSAGIGTHGQSCRSTNGGAGPPINAIRTPERDDWR